nr:type III polyketide synthase [Sphingomonas jejuensis]
MPVFINRIATAVPSHDIHHAFVDWATGRLADARERKLFARMAARAAIGARWSVLPPTDTGGSPVAADGFYAAGDMPPTSRRMAIYAAEAPALAERAVRALDVSLGPVTHLVVASCTGFVAPGIDQILAERLGLPASTERLLVGFMGCYAAVAALRSARHIVRSDPAARVLVVTVELSTLHLQPAVALEPLLAMLQFGDGAAAAILSADPAGLEITDPFAAALPDSADLIRWDIGDTGFAMHLSGEVPGRIATALAAGPVRDLLVDGSEPDAWAVHAGGRSILDAVAGALNLPPAALDDSRAVLSANGNMSSATLMFVLARMMDRPVSRGIALAFGPGLAAEGFRFHSA